MPKIAKALTAIEVKRLTAPGLHAVGTVPGLRLLVKPSGARSWVLRCVVGTRRAELGLGGYPGVPLAGAIEAARQALLNIKAGTDPVAERRARRVSIDRTFKRCADDYIAAHRAGWRNAKHAEQWSTTLQTYCFPHFGDKHVAQVDKADILAAIEPEWTTKNETMSRLRGRLESILSYSMQRGYRPEGPNPARWRGNLDAVLPKPSKVNGRAHHEALPIDAVRGFAERLRHLDGMSARALEFQLLTAARSGEVRGAVWEEIDLVAETWTVPATRMKGGREHRVPLSRQAVQLLSSLPRLEDSNLVFPGRSAKPLSDMSLTACMRRMRLTAVPHGLRSTFRDWIAERTSYPNEMAELALAHAVRDKTEAAYRRGDMFEKRRKMMADWATFVRPTPTAGAVLADRDAA